MATQLGWFAYIGASLVLLALFLCRAGKIYYAVYVLLILGIIRVQLLHIHLPQYYILEQHATKSDTAFNIKIRKIDDGKDYATVYSDYMLLRLPVESASNLHIGQIIEVDGKLNNMTGARNTGEFDQAVYYKSRGIYFSMYTDDFRVINNNIDPYREFLRSIKKSFKAKLSKLFDAQDRGIVVASLLGDRSLLDENVYTYYKHYGIAHLLAISGLHIAILGVGLYRFLRKRISIHRYTSALIASICILSYGNFVSASTSVIRAVIMLMTAFLAECLGRTYDLLSAMSLSALILIIINPYHLYDCSYILSFLAVFAIGGVAPHIIKTYQINSIYIKVFLSSIIVQIITLPAILYFFFRFPPYAFIINLIAIPLMSVVIYASICGGLSAYIHPYIGVLIVYPVKIVLTIYRILTEYSAKLPFGSVLMGRPRLWQIAAYYISMYLAYLIIKQYKRIKDRLKPMLLVFISSLCILILIPVKLGTHIYFIDVGQGDGMYMSHASENLLIDCGSGTKKGLGEFTLFPFLEANAVDKINKVYITHADYDHVSGIQYLLSDTDICIGEVILPEPARSDAKYNTIRELCHKRSVSISYMHAGSTVRCGNGILSCVSPKTDYNPSNTNEQSLVTVYKEGNFSAVFTGDAGRDTEKIILTNKNYKSLITSATLLKVGHHGSFTSSSEEFIKTIIPKYAILSYGDNNAYGHPQRETLYTLKKYNIDVYSTAESGAIHVWTDGKRMKIKSFISEPHFHR